MKVELLSVPGCPNVDVTCQRVLEAAARAGVDVDLIAVEVATLEQARQRGMRGSPTVLVDGRDVVEGDAAPSISCRLYVGGNGYDGSPSLDALERALRR